MSKKIEEYLSIIPENYRKNLTLLEAFKGNRTICKFTFMCGCETVQLLKAILKLKNFQYCFSCKGKFCEKYTCKYCQTEFIQLKMYEKCKAKCEAKYKNSIENIDFVICQICGLHSKSLGSHIRKDHFLTTKDYKEQFLNIKIISDNSHNNYSLSAIDNGNWINKAIEKGEDLTEYWEKVSIGVKQAIANNPEESVRRAAVMTKVNQSDVMKEKSSKTAKETSARPDIQLARSQKLKKWREDNPEDFYNKCVFKMITTFQSKPEKKLYEYVNNLHGFNFKRNQFINSELISNKSHNKQIDIGDKDKGIYIEFDGILHFLPKYGDETLASIKRKDNEIDQYISINNCTLIRIAYDQFIYKVKMINKIKQDNSYFKQECLDELLTILNNKIPGIYKIGEAYGKY